MLKAVFERAGLGMTLAAIISCGGARAQSIPDIVDVEPFRQLTDVYLGMEARILLKQRPEARRLEDFLLGETVGPYQVYYMFPLPYPAAGQVPRLKEIRAVRNWQTQSLAAQDWRSQTSELRRRFGVPVRCVTATRSGSDDVVRYIVWRHEDVNVALALARDGRREFKVIASIGPDAGPPAQGEASADLRVVASNCPN